MDWTAANAAAQSVRNYQEAFKNGRMDLVQKEADLFEQSMQTLSSATGIQSMRQTMDINRSTEERAAQMFPGKLEQQGATLESTQAGTAASQASTVAQEQQTRLIEEADREQKEALEIAKQILIANDVDVTNPLVGKALSDILSTATTAAELLAGLKENLPAMKIATAKKEIKAAGEVAETTGMKARVERQIPEEDRVGAIRGGLKAEAMKPEAMQSQIKLAESQASHMDALVENMPEKIKNEMLLLDARIAAETNKANKLRLEADKIELLNAALEAEGYDPFIIDLNQAKIDAGLLLKRNYYIGELRMLTTAAATIQSRATIQEVIDAVQKPTYKPKDEDESAGMNESMKLIKEMWGGASQTAALSDAEKQAAIDRIDSSIKSVVKMAQKDWADFDWEGYLEEIKGSGTGDVDSELDSIFGGE